MKGICGRREIQSAAGHALFEQDGVLFYKESYEYELLSSLLYVFVQDRKLSVCDYGGALGSTYYRYERVLPKQGMDWSIIEQTSFVDYGQKNISDIEFYYSLEECMDDHDCNVVLLHSVLPYLEDPYGLLENIFTKNTKYVILDETVFQISDDSEESIVLQHVPERIYEAVYPSHIFNERKMIQAFEKAGYRKVFEWVYPGGAIQTRTKLGFKENIDRGFLFQKID